MVVMLDGCDGTGKTTISEKLANKLGCNIIRLTNGGDRSLIAYRELYSCENVVHDRTFLSEVIYPKYFNRDSRLAKNDEIALFNLIRARFENNMFILTASDEAIRERIGKRGDEFISDINLFKQINADYIKLAKKEGYCIIDTTDKSIDAIVEEIGGHLK